MGFEIQVEVNSDGIGRNPRDMQAGVEMTGRGW